MYTVRKAENTDVVQLTELYGCFIAEMNQYESTDNSSDADTLSWINKSLNVEDAAIFVAEDEGCIYGFVRLQSKERTLVNNEVRRYAKLNDLYIVPKVRRTGVAHLLISASMNWTKHLMLPEIVLNVYESNMAAHSLYKTVGFVDDECISLRRVRMKFSL